MLKPQVEVVPLTIPVANDCVTRWHRHHAPLPGGFAWFCIGAVADGMLCGAAIAGRPTNRNNDDRQTIEVLRVATDGTPNAPSALLGACARTARGMGAARIVTYTLDSEGGASLRGAGWQKEADGITSWWHTGQSRIRAITRDHMSEQKVRWALDLRQPIEYEIPVKDAPEPQAALF